MKYNTKILGNYIQQTDLRNDNKLINLLLGVSIDKKFIPSIANTIGTDFSNYKIVRKNEFAYGPVTSRNGDKISIALLTDYNECIISSSYITFKIIDSNEIDAEYLMLLFSNSEFDRYARYNSWGSAREVFSWNDLCNTKINLPDIDIQRKIVKLYKYICNEIDILSYSCQELEKIALCKFKYELLNNKCHSFKLENLGEIITGKTPSMNVKKYYNNEEIPFIKTPDMHNNVFITKYESYLSKIGAESQKNKYLPEHTVIMSCIGSAGEISLTSEVSQTNQQINAIVSEYPYFVYCLLKKEKDKILVLGEGSTTMVNINKTDFSNYIVEIPDKDIISDIKKKKKKIFIPILEITKTKQKFIQIQQKIIDELW